MKFLLPFLICATFLIAYAAPGWDFKAPPDGFKWPEVSAEIGEEKTYEVGSLEADVRKAVSDFWPDNIPATILMRKADLNKDGQDELFIYLPESSGTGGSVYEILTREEKGYRSIGSVQGSIYLLVPRDGWLQIESASSGGGGVFARTLLRYIKGEYANVRSELHDFKDQSIEVRKGSVKK